MLENLLNLTIVTRMRPDLVLVFQVALCLAGCDRARSGEWLRATIRGSVVCKSLSTNDSKLTKKNGVEKGKLDLKN